MTTVLASILPPGRTQFVNGDGVPLAGGSVYFYVPGTTTLKDTWQDAGEVIINTNPVTLDGNGSALIYGNGQYTMSVFDSNGNLLYTALTAQTTANISLPSGTSLSSNTISTGLLTFTTQADLDFVPGMAVLISSTADNTNNMFGIITSYSTATGVIVVNVTSTEGSGTYASWDIVMSGSPGATGSTGPQGPPGPTGATGAGVPVGGTTGQALVKNSNANYDTTWGNAASTAITSVNVQVITASGTYTPTANMVYVIIINIGGGNTGGTNGSGAGSGATAIKLFSAAMIGSSQAVVIGSNLGGTTTFGAFLSCTGGGAGVNGGGAGTGVTGGTAGIASGGDININGQRGSGGMEQSGGATGISGNGGSTLLGLGGAGTGFTLPGNPSTAINASGYGAGGNGGGGSGTTGVVVALEFCKS